MLRGDHALLIGMVCELLVIIPSLDGKQPAGMASLQAEVFEVVFACGDILLDFRVKSLSNEARQLIDKYKVAA